MQRVISAPMVRGDISPYFSPETGKVISSRAARDNDLKKHGKILYESGLKEQIAGNRQRAIAASDARIENLVNITTGALEASGRI